MLYFLKVCLPWCNRIQETSNKEPPEIKPEEKDSHQFRVIREPIFNIMEIAFSGQIADTLQDLY